MDNWGSQRPAPACPSAPSSWICRMNGSFSNTHCKKDLLFRWKVQVKHRLEVSNPLSNSVSLPPRDPHPGQSESGLGLRSLVTESRSVYTPLEQTVAAEHPGLQNNKEENKPIIIIFFAWHCELTQRVSGLPPQRVRNQVRADQPFSGLCLRGSFSRVLVGCSRPGPYQAKADPDDNSAVPAWFLEPKAPLWISLENSEVPRVAYTSFTP